MRRLITQIHIRIQLLYTRIDPIYANNSGNPLRLWDEDAAGFCTGTGYTYPDLQEINYSINGGTSWFGGATTSSYLDYYLPSTWTPYPNFNVPGGSYGYVDPYGVMISRLTLPTGTYTILVRQRNIVY